MNNKIKIVLGIFFTLAIALSAQQISHYIGENLLGYKKSPISAVIIAIVIGMILGNFFPWFLNIEKGFEFVAKFILRLGIILLGIRLSFSELLAFGIKAIPLVIICIVGILLIIKFFIKYLKVSEKMSYLISIGTGICGATAIIATAPVINAKKEEVAYAITNITIFGVIAMFFYPYLANFLFHDQSLQVGLFLGTAIHETAQVAASGLIYADQFSNPEVINSSTVTKLVRNSFLVIFIPLVAHFYNSKNNPGQSYSIVKIFPFFVLGFILFAVIRSIGDYYIVQNVSTVIDKSLWKLIISTIKNYSEIFLTMAMAAMGLLTNFTELRKLGVKPFLVGLIAAVSAGLISATYILFFVF
jgi:uncharacterized integral membrane protein (TIGR00698 family)